MEAFPKQDGIWTLELAESDIRAGTHRGMLPAWSNITVGAEIWKGLRR